MVYYRRQLLEELLRGTSGGTTRGTSGGTIRGTSGGTIRGTIKRNY